MELDETVDTASFAVCTRDVLAAKKVRKFSLGTPANFTDEAKQKGLAARQANALANSQQPAGRTAGHAAAGHSLGKGYVNSTK